jgi:hypothetical protein
MARINIREISVLLDTNIPGKEIVPLKKSILYQPKMTDTSTWNELPYFTSDAEYPEGYLARLPYEKQMQFFFNKNIMENTIELQSSVLKKQFQGQTQGVQTESQQKKEREEKSALIRKQENISENEQLKRKENAERASKEAAAQTTDKIKALELSQIKMIDPDTSFTGPFDNYISSKTEEVNKKNEELVKLIKEMRELTQIKDIFKPAFSPDSPKLKEYIEEVLPRKNRSITNWGGESPINPKDVFDKDGLFTSEFCELKERNEVDNPIFENESNITPWTQYKASIIKTLNYFISSPIYQKNQELIDKLITILDKINGIQIVELTKTQEGQEGIKDRADNRNKICGLLITIKNLFSQIEPIDEGILKFAIESIKKTKEKVDTEKRELLSNKPELEKLLLEKSTTEQKNIKSFDENPTTINSEVLAAKEAEELRSKTTEKNVMIMLRLMFPTKYPIVGNVFSSFHSVVTGENDIRLKWTDFIPGFLKKRVFEGFADYSYLKIDGQVYTVVQAIWQNDIYNHKEYKKLIDQFEELQRWKEQQLVKISTELDKKRRAFKQTYESQFSQDDVENIRRTKLEKPEDEVSKRYNLSVDTLINIMEDLIASIGRGDYLRMNDYANKFAEKFNSLRNSYEYRSLFNPQNQRKYEDITKKMREEIGNIQADEYILENYLKKPGINLDYKNDTKYRRIMEQKYQTYVKFIDNIRNFRAPVLESSNSLLQNSIEDFLNNTEKYKGVFNFLMNPINIKKNPFSLILPTTPSEEIENIKREASKYQNRMNTGVSIRPNSRGAYYEIYVQMNLIGGELNDDNKSKIDCMYQGETLGDKLSRILNEAIYHPWNINSTRVFFDITKGETKTDPKKQSPEETAATAADKQMFDSSSYTSPSSYSSFSDYPSYDSYSGYRENEYYGGKKSIKKYRQQFLKRYTRRNR